MSTYNGRRGPNVSQYLRDLNTISPQDAPSREGNFSNAMEEDLSIFTNTQFFDFDSGQNTDFQAQPGKGEGKPSSNAGRTTTAPSEEMTPASVIGDMPSLDFMAGDMTNDFAFGDFTAPYPASSINAFQEGPQQFQQIAPNHQGQAPVYGTHVGQTHAPFSPAAAGEKRKADSVAASPISRPHVGGGNFEEASRHAAEEDKRRRNTAASARFRIKKKQREQALEKSAKEMNDKVSSLENRVAQLETENKWLKNLLVEKNEGNDEISTLWKEFSKQAIEKTKSGDKARAER